MKTKLWVLGCIAILLPFASALNPADPQAEPQADPQSDKASFIILGTIVSETNLRNRKTGVPDKWTVDIYGDGAAELILYSPTTEPPGCEFMRKGMRFEAEIRLIDLRREEYQLVRWIRFGRLP